MKDSLVGKVALVAGGTRGAGRGIAVELGTAGATVYVTGRTSGSERSEMNRPETIEETAALVDEVGGHGIPVKVDHLVPNEVHLRKIRMCRAGTEKRCLAGSLQKFTDSPTLMAASPMLGDTFPKLQTRVNPLTQPAIADIEKLLVVLLALRHVLSNELPQTGQLTISPLDCNVPF